jgi:molybdopterin-binding protein
MKTNQIEPQLFRDRAADPGPRGSPGYAPDEPSYPWHPETMPISARNQLEGKIVDVTLGDIMAHVVVEIGKNHIESVITRRSAEQLALKKGDTVTVVIKSTEVMLQKE